MFKNYYLSSFFWSTLSKILNAIFGFIAVPLLLGLYGKADYGILSIATACNSYMHLLDLGMNIGTVKFFSQWKTTGQFNKIFNVSRTNITFYIIIATINILGLLLLAFCGENLFAISHEQFKQLQICLIIIALFSLFSWGATPFNQLLIANNEIAFTMKVQCVQVILKIVLVCTALIYKISLISYFFFLTSILASLILPYTFKCKKLRLIDSFKPATNWFEFKPVLVFSLSLFALSLFQVTATQSRPIILSIFTNEGAISVADFRIIEVIPSFIITIGGAFSSIFLPKTSEMVASQDSEKIHVFAYKWTSLTSILANILCIPFIICSKEILSAYVGSEYSHLSNWLVLWIITVLFQIHTTPGNSLVLAYGKTKMLVITSAIACFISIIINIQLCKIYNVGSAVIGYFIYVIIVVGLYYIVYYQSLMGLSRIRMLSCFLIPTLISFFLFFIIDYVPLNFSSLFNLMNERLAYISICIIKTLIWIIPYMILLLGLKIIDVKDIIIK